MAMNLDPIRLSQCPNCRIGEEAIAELEAREYPVSPYDAFCDDCLAAGYGDLTRETIVAPTPTSPALEAPHADSSDCACTRCVDHRELMAKFWRDLKAWRDIEWGANDVD